MNVEFVGLKEDFTDLVFHRVGGTCGRQIKQRTVKVQAAKAAATRSH